MSELRELLHAQANAASKRCEKAILDNMALRSKVNRLMAEIFRHKRRCVIDPQPWDLDLWGSLDA